MTLRATIRPSNGTIATAVGRISMSICLYLAFQDRKCFPNSRGPPEGGFPKDAALQVPEIKKPYLFEQHFDPDKLPRSLWKNTLEGRPAILCNMHPHAVVFHIQNARQFMSIRVACALFS